MNVVTIPVGGRMASHVNLICDKIKTMLNAVRTSVGLEEETGHAEMMGAMSVSYRYEKKVICEQRRFRINIADLTVGRFAFSLWNKTVYLKLEVKGTASRNACESMYRNEKRYFSSMGLDTEVCDPTFIYIVIKSCDTHEQAERLFNQLRDVWVCYH
jgi:hypothetical protein